MILGVRSKPPGGEVPVISQNAGDRETDAKFGMQLLVAHNNWPIGPADMLKLDLEREEYWNGNADRKAARPNRVEPTWFDTTQYDLPASTTSQQPTLEVSTKAAPAAEVEDTASVANMAKRLPVKKAMQAQAATQVEHEGNSPQKVVSSKALLKKSTLKRGLSRTESKKVVRKRALPKAGNLTGTDSQPVSSPETEGPEHIEANKTKTSPKSSPKESEASQNPASPDNDDINGLADGGAISDGAATANNSKTSKSGTNLDVGTTRATAKTAHQQTKPTKRKRQEEKSTSSVGRKAPRNILMVEPTKASEKETEETAAAETKSKDPRTQDKPQPPSPQSASAAGSFSSAVDKAARAAAAAVRSSVEETPLLERESSLSESRVQACAGALTVSSSPRYDSPDALLPASRKKSPDEKKQTVAESNPFSKSSSVSPSLETSWTIRELESAQEVQKARFLQKKSSQTANGRDIKMLISGENENIDGDKQKLMYCSEDDGSEHCSSVLQHDAQSPAPLGMLAELASAREATEAKASVSKDPTRHVISRESGAREVDSIKWGRSHGNTATAVSFLPLPHNDRRPSPSRRGRSDGSGDSIHRAGTPKSHNMLSVASDDRSRRGRTKVGVGAPEMPDLKADKDAGGAKQQLQARPAEKETATAGQKRRAEGAKMELPKAIKRQRSFPQGGFMGSRPPLIINRQRSTGSRLSFADEVQIAEPGFFGETLSDRRPGPAAPSALRRGDRHGSMGSLQPPSVIRAGDRQGSVESYQSLRSQDSAMQTLTPNSRLTPSLLGPASTLSPNTGTPNTARMEELYDQLDRQLEECLPQFSSSPKSMSNESPGQRFPSFRPRPMNGKRQASAAMEEADLHGDLKLPSPSQLEIQKGNGTEREVNVDRQRDLASRHTRIGEGLPSLQIPNPGDTDRSKMTTPTGQIRSFPHGGRKAVALRQPTANPNPPGRNKTYPNAQTHGSQIQMPQQSMHRMASVDSHVRPAPMAPMQPDFLKAWLEGSGETPSMEQNFRAPQPRAFQQIPQGPGYQYAYGIAAPGPDPHSRIPPSFQQPHIRNPHTYEGRGQPPARVPGYESYLPNHRPDVSQLRPRKVVEFGHPREDVVEGRQIYSRHTLLLWGAHKSDVCPVNGNPRDGCDSIIYMNEGGEVPNTKDDLGFLQLKCSQRNGGDALFANYQKSQQRNATHSYPIRVFRKTTDLSGASGFRYDGLYHVAAIHDDRGRPRSEPSNSSKTFSFLLKRNIAGQAGDQNQHMLEELWGVVQQGDPPPHQQQQRHVGGVQTNDLHLPPLSHGGRGYRGGHQQGAMGVTAPMHPHLKRMSSAEVSLIHIRYYDQDQQNHHLNQVQRLQVLLQQGPPSAVPSAQPWAAR